MEADAPQLRRPVVLLVVEQLGHQLAEAARHSVKVFASLGFQLSQPVEAGADGIALSGPALCDGLSRGVQQLFEAEAQQAVVIVPFIGGVVVVERHAHIGAVVGGAAVPPIYLPDGVDGAVVTACHTGAFALVQAAQLTDVVSRRGRLRMQLDKDKLAAYRVMLLDVVDAHDLLQLVELLDDLLEDDLVALHDDRHARNARIIGRGNGQRVDVVAAAAEKAGNARQNTGVILYGDRKDKLLHWSIFPFLSLPRDRRSCRLPGASEKYHHKNTINMKRILTITAVSLLALSPMYGQEAYAGYDCVTLLDSTAVTVQPTGSGAFAVCKAFKVQTPKGAVANRIIKYDYDPLTAHAEFRYATIYRANGDVINLDVTGACDYAAPARAIYWGARQIMLEVGRLQPGDVVEYEIAKKGFTYALLTAGDDERFIPPMRGQFYDIVPFWATEPTVRKVYRISMPMEKELQFQFYQGECTSSMRYEDGRKVYTFASDDILPFAKEPNMVDLFDAAPKLMMSSTPRWEDKSVWFNKVNEDYGSFTAIPEAQRKVDELIKGKKTEMEKIAVLTHWVADNIRYSGISMGKGEGFTLHNLKMNYTDRCGVCKDIAGTLIAFLRMAGFEAYPAMTMAGSRVESIPADHFNHCVAVVKLASGTYMPLDPTWVPFCRELWSSAEQQQNYLPGVPEGSDLCLTPVSAPENHYVRIHADNRLDEKGTLRGQFTITAEGQSDSNIRRIFTTGWQSDWQNTMEKQLLAVSPNAKLLRVDYGKDPKNYQAAPIKITFSYEIPDYAIIAGDQMLIKPLVMNNLYNQVKSFLRIDTKPENRAYGFKDACSRLVEQDETIRLPKGYTLLNAPKNDALRSNAADFEGSLSQEGDRNIVLRQKLALKKRVYDAADWKGFRSAVNAYKSYGDYLIIKK